MKIEELKTILDYQRAFMCLTKQCEKQFGGTLDSIRIYPLDGDVRIEWR